jgi:hypothetical protein
MLAHKRISSILYFLLCNFYGSFDIPLRYFIVSSANFSTTNYIILFSQKPLALPEVLVRLRAALYSCFAF